MIELVNDKKLSEGIRNSKKLNLFTKNNKSKVLNEWVKLIRNISAVN